LYYNIIIIYLLKTFKEIFIYSIIYIVIMLYQTQDQEIIELYEIYNELKLFINSIENAKEYLINNNITRQTNSYTILKADKPTYNNFKKVYKILFYDMIDRTGLNKFVKLYQEYTNLYMVNLDDDKLYLRNRNDKILKLEQYETLSISNIFKGYIFENLKEILKKLIKAKISNKEITPFYYN